MITVRAIAAMKYLSSLLERARAQRAFDRLIELRKGTTLGGLCWKDLRDEGRR